MIALAWTVFALLALAWTAAAWITAAGAAWGAQALASGSATHAARELAAVPLPDWLDIWIDATSLEALQSALRWAIDTASAVLPFAADAAGWLVPLVWIGWGFGMVLLLLVATGSHLLLRRLERANSRRGSMTGMA